MSALTKALGAGAAILTGTALLGVGGYALNETAADQLAATMTERAAPLLPGGSVEHAEVTDSPALLTERRRQVQQTMIDGGTADGHPVLMIVREFDRDSGRAQSVSWQVGALPLAPGWTGLRSSEGAYLDVAEHHVDGHVARVRATAVVQGSTVVVGVGDLTVDGAPTALADAPTAVRQALAPLSFAVPLPTADNTVRSIWFDEEGLGVELYARDVMTVEG